MRAGALGQRTEQETRMPQGMDRAGHGSRSRQEVAQLGVVGREGTCRICWTVNQPAASQPRLG